MRISVVHASVIAIPLSSMLFFGVVLFFFIYTVCARFLLFFNLWLF